MRIEGSDVNYARVQDQKFFFAEGTETIATIIGRSDAIPATIVESSSSRVRYKSVWNFTVPQLKQGATYKIWSQINCQPRLNVFNFSEVGNRAVLAATSEQENLSLIDRILSFLNNLFGDTSTAPAAIPTVTPVQKGQGQGTTLGDSIRLEPIYPAEVYQKTCSFIKFRYDFPSQ